MARYLWEHWQHDLRTKAVLRSMQFSDALLLWSAVRLLDNSPHPALGIAHDATIGWRLIIDGRQNRRGLLALSMFLHQCSENLRRDAGCIADQHQQVADVVQSLLKAFEDGDRERALSLFPAEKRRTIERRLSTRTVQPWLPASGVTLSVDKIALALPKATAHLRAQKDGFVLRPIVHLVRAPDGRWLIHGLSRFRLQTRETEIQGRRETDAAEALARELRKALRGIDGEVVDGEVMNHPSGSVNNR